MLEANIVQQDRASYGGPAAGKEVLQHLVANDADEPLLGVVSFIEPPAGGQGKIPYRVEMRRYANHLAVGVAVLADLPDIVSPKNRRYGSNVRGIALYVQIVLVGQFVGVPGAHVARHCRSAAREDEHDVLAHGVHFLAVAGAEPLSQPHQQQQ